MSQDPMFFQGGKCGLGEYVQRNSKVGVEGEKSICNSREELREPEGFCRKCCKGPMRDDAMRMIAKNVFAG